MNQSAECRLKLSFPNVSVLALQNILIVCNVLTIVIPLICIGKHNNLEPIFN